MFVQNFIKLSAAVLELPLTEKATMVKTILLMVPRE